MKHTITVPLTEKGIDQLIKKLDEYERWLKQRCQALVDRLAQEGYQISQAKFSTAVYDGTNDVTVRWESRGENIAAVVAVGNATLFIEFGTGVMYPDDHPEKPTGIVGRGEYGKGYGKNRAWGYYGDDAGTNGQFATKADGSLREPHVVLTHGNPANAPMYSTVQELRENFARIAREVFGDA